MDDRTRITDLKVGIFVTLGVIVLVAVIFTIGQERQLFEKPVFLRAQFRNVSGLNLGAQIQLSGVDVGIVSRIDFPPLDKDADFKLLGETPVATYEVGSILPLKGGTKAPIEPASLDEHAKAAAESIPFDEPTTLALTARAPRDLMVIVEVFGYDSQGRPIKERLRAEPYAGEDVSGVGNMLFSRVHRARLVKATGAVDEGVFRLGTSRGKKITVTMRVRSNVLERIRHDSVARVDSLGLLGDKIIDISLGSSGAPPHKDGDIIRSEEGPNLNEILSRAQRTVNKFTEGGFEEFFGDAGDVDLPGLVNAVKTLAEQIENEEVVGSAKDAVDKLNKDLALLEQILKDVKEGDGLVSALIYGDGGKKTITAARETLEEAKGVIHDVRTKEGVLHQLIYKEDSGAMVTNLTAASEDLKVASADVKEVTGDVKAMVADVKQGKGTVGALITDPTVYEDLKLLLGNVKRNDAVKSLVRYAIEREDRKSSR